MSFRSSRFPGTPSPDLRGQEIVTGSVIQIELLQFTWGPGSSHSDLFDQPGANGASWRH